MANPNEACSFRVKHVYARENGEVRSLLFSARLIIQAHIDGNVAVSPLRISKSPSMISSNPLKAWAYAHQVQP
jgi:hypothetical protein